MEDLQNFTPDNTSLGVYFRIKKEFPLLEEEIINAMAFEELNNDFYFKQVKEQKIKENEMLKSQIENNKNKIIENGMESLTPLEMIVNKIDYTINDEITELLKSFDNINVSNEHEHKVKTIES